MRINTDNYQTTEMKTMVKELMEMNQKLIEEQSKNINPNNYENTIGAFVNKWSWSINNLFSWSLVKYGAIAGVVGYFLYKVNWLSSLISFAGYLTENFGLLLQGKLELQKKFEEFDKSTRSFFGRTWNYFASWIDPTRMGSIGQFNSLSVEKFFIGAKMFIYLKKIMGWGKGYLGLIFQNLDHFIFQKDPEKLIKICDDVSNLTGFNQENCISDVVNAYNIFHEAFPDMYNDLLTPKNFNRLLATVQDKSLFSEEGGYKNISEIESLEKYLIDYSKNPPKNNDLNLPNIDLPIDNNQSLIRNFFSFFGWVSMFIQMITGFWKLGSTLKQMYDQRTQSTITTNPDRLPLTNNDLPTDSTEQQGEDDDTNSSPGKSEGPTIEMIDEPENDVEKNLRKRR